MHFQSSIVLALSALLGLATAAPSTENPANALMGRTNPKANEYKTGDWYA